MIGELSAYLARIGFAGQPRADLATLRQLALRHALAIPFENLDPFLGRGVSLLPADVERKLVAGRRGGWCFEHNLLLGNALRAIGFDVHDLAARVLWGRDELARTPRTHRLLRVGVAGREWLVDGGFGGLTLTGVLDLDDRQPQQTPHEPFRLRPLDGDLLLEAEIADRDAGPRWRPLYRFDLKPQWPVDFEAANFQLAHDPQSHFVTTLIAARPVAGGRCSLRNRELTLRAADGQVERRVLGDAAQLLEVLQEVFGIDTASLTGLAPRFAGLALA